MAWSFGSIVVRVAGVAAVCEDMATEGGAVGTDSVGVAQARRPANPVAPQARSDGRKRPNGVFLREDSTRVATACSAERERVCVSLIAGSRHVRLWVLVGFVMNDALAVC